MTWQLITNETVAVYQLTDGNQTTTTLKLNKATGSIRLSYGMNRLFFINQVKGSVAKCNITNEYGYSIGSVTCVDETTGTVSLDQQMFFYITENGSTRIFNQRNETVLDCNASVPAMGVHHISLLFASLWMYCNAQETMMHHALQQPYASYARM